jgi:hypothetical protein
MFSQFRNVVEGLAQPRLPQASPRRSGSVERASPPKPLAERHANAKTKLEDRLRASFTIGEVSNPSTPAGSSRVSPAPQFVAEHPLSIDHPLSPAAIPLPTSPPPNGLDSDFDPLPLDASLSLPDPLSPTSPDAPGKSVPSDPGSNSVVELEPPNHSSPPESPSADSPVKSPVPEQSLVASEDDTGVYDATQSTSTPKVSYNENNEGSNVSVVETTHADQYKSGEISMLTEQSQSETGHSVSADVESLQEQLSMEQRFAGQW